jgi:hypothetical protein
MTASAFTSSRDWDTDGLTLDAQILLVAEGRMTQLVQEGFVKISE